MFVAEFMLCRSKGWLHLKRVKTVKTPVWAQKFENHARKSATAFQQVWVSPDVLNLKPCNLATYECGKDHFRLEKEVF